MVQMLLLQGMSQRAICEALKRSGVKHASLATIRGDTQWLEEQWRKNFVEDRAAAKRQQLAAYRFLMTKAWDAFSRSQKDDVTVTEKTFQAEDGSKIVERTERTRGQAGSPHLLGEIRAILGQIDDLYGLSEVKVTGEIDVTGKAFGADVARALEQMAEQLAEQPTVPVVDGQVIESHVLSHGEGNGDGKPQLEHEPQAEEDESDETE
jgi:hypothetical protein